MVRAAPYASMVMDARTGEVLRSRNADSRLHPASLTKMMTLYIAFEAIENGEISADTKVEISRKAAAEPPSKLGLKAGQKIALRYLIRAAAIKSANDAATAIGEAISGSEAAFARRMNRTAKAMGMTRTTFKNAHGLTENGHLSTARDMTLLGRHVFYDYPEYYPIFKRRTTHAGLREVYNTNRKFLGAYSGADGIKTGYTRAAGYNLVASAERRGVRIITTVFGGRSTRTRNAHVAELMDIGFQRADRHVDTRKPSRPAYNPGAHAGSAQSAVARSIRPRARPGPQVQEGPLIAGMEDTIAQTLALVDLDARGESMVAEGAADPLIDLSPPTKLPPRAASRPQPRSKETAEVVSGLTQGDVPLEPTQETEAPAPEVVTRLSTAGGRHWAITIGKFPSRHTAERMLLETALLELGTLDSALRRVVQRAGGFEANFVGLSEEQADLACRRLSARKVTCSTLGPG
ncbi:MAG: D-alanyl-D-alanine carboxypeptidase family protein [Pseudomonadota bacterium]